MSYQAFYNLPFAHYFFDFDGVILDSVAIKTQAYRKIFQSYGKQAVNWIDDFHQRNGGISRTIKIRHVLDQLQAAGVNIDDVEGEHTRLVQAFADTALELVLECDFMPGALDLLNHLQNSNKNMYVVSGTPQEELRKIVDKRKLSSYFKEVRGSPVQKVEILSDLVTKYSINPVDAVFWGDATTDFLAAREMGLFFVGVPESSAIVGLDRPEGIDPAGE